MIEKVNNKFMGLSGPVWCLFAGLGYGCNNVLFKLAYERGAIVSRAILTRHLVLAIGSYVFGKCILKADFRVWKAYPYDILKLIFLRSIFNTISKTCQYAAISYIPLALSSTISFTTGPIFAAILAFVYIGERLSLVECGAVTLGILGTTLLTMPQWFAWMGLDSEAIETRFKNESHGNYFFGILIALISSALDVVTYFIIRKLGNNIPSSIIVYCSGIITAFNVSIYCLIYEPFDYYFFINLFFNNPKKEDILYA